MTWLKGNEFKWVNTGVNVFDAVAVWGAAYGEEEKLFSPWSKCECA